MSLSSEFISALEVIAMFDLGNPQQGIKVHHDAAPERIAATKRLYDLGMITLADGGYLTVRGQETAELAATLINLLEVKH